MKKAFSCITVLLVSIMLLVTSCTNSSQVTFTDQESNNSYTDDGYSVATIKISSTPEYERTAFPSDWTDANMKKLVYQIKGVPNTSGSGSAQSTDGWTTITPLSTGKNFTYEQIASGLATIEVDPGYWDFTLEVFQPKGTIDTGVAPTPDPDKMVLKAEQKDVDLTTGTQVVNFPLSSKDVSGAAATGEVAIDVYFQQGDGLKSVTLTSDAAPVADTTVVDKEVSDVPSIIPGDGGWCKASYTGIIKAGKCTFTATFKDGESVPNTILTYEETLVIDGGNKTAKEIYIPKESYNRKPAAATELKSSCEYVPNGTKLTIDAGKKKYAQERTDTTLTGDTYDLVLTWKDNAFNEAGYKVTFTTIDPSGANKVGDITVAYNSGEPSVPNVSSGTPNAADIITVKTGNLAPSTNSITLSVPTGVFCQDIKVVAYNNLGDSPSDPIANSAEYDPIDGAGHVSNIAGPTGLFTIIYDLKDPHAASTPVTYNISGATTSKQYFVAAYPYVADSGVGENLIQTPDAAVAYPFIKNDSFNFGGWYFSDGNKIPASKPALIETANDAKLKGSDFNYLNQNISLKGSWTTTVGVSVTFPSYSGAQGLQVLDKLMGNVLELKYGETGTIAVPTEVAKSLVADSLKFAVYAPDATDVAIFEALKSGPGTPCDGITADLDTAKSLTIDQTALLTTAKKPAGIYRVYVSYTYKDSSGVEYPIDGNLFVKVTNGTK